VKPEDDERSSQGDLPYRAIVENSLDAIALIRRDASVLRLIVSGNKYVSRSLADRLIEEIQRDTNKPPHETLSDREYEVMSLIASGKSMKEVGAALSLSKSTVSTYRLRLLDKLKVKSNAEITRYALHHGLVS